MIFLELSAQHKKELARIAQVTVDEYAYSGMTPPGKPHTEILLVPAAVLLRLTAKAIDSTLGAECTIGCAVADRPLYQQLQTIVILAWEKVASAVPQPASIYCEISETFTHWPVQKPPPSHQRTFWCNKQHLWQADYEPTKQPQEPDWHLVTGQTTDFTTQVLLPPRSS